MSSNNTNTNTRYRLLRVLEYVGDAEFVRQAVEKRGVKGRLYTRNGYIQEAVVGETAVPVEPSPPLASAVRSVFVELLDALVRETTLTTVSGNAVRADWMARFDAASEGGSEP